MQTIPTLARNDGSQQVLIDKDGNGTFEERFEYIAGGAVDTYQVWAENGTTTLTDWDQADQYVWASKNTVSDAQGRLDYAEEFSDDGTIAKDDFDQTDSFSWAQLRSVWDAQGRFDYSEEFSDDGTIAKDDFDQTDSFSWAQLRSVWDAQGRFDYSEEFSEDGTITKNDFDQTNSFSWKESRSVWDAQGRADYTVEFSDNEAITKNDFDQSLAFDWNIYKTAWDPQGRKDIVGIEYDNGSKRNYDYDSAGAIDYQSWALSDGNRGWEDYSNGAIFGYDKWDHVAGTRADVRSWNNKDLDASRIDYGWERYDDYVGWDSYSRKSWDIHRTDKFFGAKGEMHSWKLDDKNYGWHFKSFSNGAVMYESVENGRFSTEHNLTNPFNGQPGNVLFVRSIPTFINWSNINVDA